MTNQTHTHPAPSARLVAARMAVAESLCAQRGQRFTPIRRKVLELLLRHGRSLKAYDLLSAMRAEHPSAAPPTVYRALDFLLAEGLIHRLDAINAWVACIDAEDAHPDLLLIVCTQCGSVAEVHDPELCQHISTRVAHMNYVPTTHEIEVRALCPNCQQISTHGKQM